MAHVWWVGSSHPGCGNRLDQHIHSLLWYTFSRGETHLASFSMATDGADPNSTVQVQSEADTIMKQRIELKSKLVGLLDNTMSQFTMKLLIF